MVDFGGVANVGPSEVGFDYLYHHLHDLSLEDFGFLVVSEGCGCRCGHPSSGTTPRAQAFPEPPWAILGTKWLERDALIVERFKTLVLNYLKRKDISPLDVKEPPTYGNSMKFIP